MQTKSQNSDGKVPTLRRRAYLSKLLALLAVLALVVAACGDDGGATDDTDAADPEIADTDATTPEEDEGAGDVDEGSSDPVELTVWFARDYYIPPDNFESFHEMYPHITVKTDVQPADDIFEILIRMNDAGQQLPDVVQGDGFFQPGMHESGISLPLNDLLDTWEEEDPESFNEVYPVVWEQGSQGDTVVSMANTAQMGQIFYRADWFAEAGIDEFPDTWDGLLDALRAVRDTFPDIQPWGMRGQPGTINRHAEQAVAMGVVFDDEGIPLVDSEAGHYYINWMQTLMREGLVASDTLAWDTDDYRGAFIASQIAAHGESIGKAIDVIDGGLAFGEEFDIGFLPLSRSGEGVDGSQMAWFRIWNITSTTEHPYEASLVLRYLMEEQNAIEVTLGGGDLPRTASVLEADEIRNSYAGFTDEFAEEFADAGGPPLTTAWFQLEGVWESMLQEALLNPDTPAAELAAKWQAEFDALRG